MNFKNKKTELIIAISFCLLTMISCLFLYYKNSKIETINIEHYEVADNLLNFFLDCNEKQGNDYVISGWAYKPNENIKFFNNAVVLKDVEENKYYKCNTKFFQRADVTAHFNDGFDYTNSGFYVKVGCSKFIKGKAYQLCFLYQSSDNNMLNCTETRIVPNP